MTATPGSEWAWRPTAPYLEAANMGAFLRHVGVDDLAQLNVRADADPEWFWDSVLEYTGVRFFEPYTRVMDTAPGIAWTEWCVGGRTNVVLNCLDKHRGTAIWDKTYAVWEGENGRRRDMTYAEFDAEVCRLAAALEGLGLAPGDVVGLYLPMLPESFAALFAVVKIGAVVLPLFSGFGAEAIRVRLSDSDAHAVITADATWRRGTLVPMKATLDQALADAGAIKAVVVVANAGDAAACPMQEGRDHWWHDLLEGQPEETPTQPMDAEAPAFLIYTSGTTGKPKGTIHPHCRIVAKTALDMGLCLDLKASDRMMWMSDMGWLVGPLTAIASTYAGASLVMAEGTPDYPDTTRHWRLAEECGVTWMGIAPTTARSLMRYGDEVDGFAFGALRILASTGEPWTRDAWNWLFERVGHGGVPILNYSGGTECYGIVAGSVLEPMKPGSFAGPIPGTGARVVDADGQVVAPGEVGELVMTRPSIGNTRSLWRDDARYMETYWSMYADMWRQGDWASVDADGMWFLLGRSDDTINVAGKRTGPAEIEGLLCATGKIVEAAVVGIPDPVKGSALCCVCVPMPGVEPGTGLDAELSESVSAGLGRAYRPKRIHCVSELPKTRNLKIMRRLVRAVLLGEPEGDLSSLVNPEALIELRRIAER